MRKGNGTGGCYARRLSGLSKLIPFEMGLQIPCSVYYPKRDGKPCLGEHGVAWVRFFMPWLGRKSARFWKVI
jgi:hypothetical protein